MNLKQVIADLESQATSYRSAADSLRKLLDQNDVAPRRGKGRPRAEDQKSAVRRGRRKKRVMSEEARARISSAQKARHEALRVAAAKKRK